MDVKIINDPNEASSALADVINQQLKLNKKVLWLVCGGSSIKIAVAASRKLTDHLPGQLTIGLTDERFGPVGHADSNWHQLVSSGLMVDSANILPTLTGSTSVTDTTNSYESKLNNALRATEFVIALFGVGQDGHIAGILPHSTAVQEMQKLVTNYDAPPFQRITVTPPFFNLINIGVIYTEDDQKLAFLKNLRNNVSPENEPVQLIKRANEFMVYHKQ